MPRKRLIFTLLYSSGHFMLSRNFRLQKVGDARWLQKNYNFSSIAFAIDELIVLDVSRGERDFEAFCETLKIVTDGCFIPIAAGGGVRSVRQAQTLLRSGADKVVVNTALFEDPDLIRELASEFGQQCVVASLDVKKMPSNEYFCHFQNGSICGSHSLQTDLRHLSSLPFGELYLNSMDRDGTGQGYDIELANAIPSDFSAPIILAGGAGNERHLSDGLKEPKMDAVATAHLFNFVGDGLARARDQLHRQGHNLAIWQTMESSRS